MSKDNLTQYSATNASNTDIGGVNIDEGMLPGDVNNAIREQMTHLKNFSDGTDAIDALAVDNLRLDGNTISSTNTNGDVTIDPNGTGNTIVASGNLGVGTTSPGFPATIQDSANHLYLKQSNQDNGWLINTADADGELHVSRRGEGASPSNNERLTISTAGNVGIGVAPETKLHVEGDVDALNDGNVMHIESNGTGGNRGINIGQEGNGSQARMFLQGYHSQSVTNYWDLLVNPFGGAVGIGTGTNAPTGYSAGGSNFVVSKSSSGSNAVGMSLVNPNSAVGTSVSLDFVPNTNVALASISSPRTAANGATDLALNTYTGASMTEKLRVTSAGAVGINQTQPGTEHTSGTVLQVKGGTANTKPAVVWLQGGSLDGAGSCCTEVFGVAGIQSATEISRLTMSGANGYRALIKVEATGHTSGKGNGHNIIQAYWDGGTSSVTTIYAYGGAASLNPVITFNTSTSNVCIVNINRGTAGTGADNFNGVVRIEWLIPVDFASSTGVVS